jgi:ADP-ribosylglycohydrolase
VNEELASKVRATLLGGALGDALGAPIEHEGIEEIRRRYGPRGVTRIVGDGHFTYGTQMTLFTCEALLIAGAELERSGQCHPPRLLHSAYRRWLGAQEDGAGEVPSDGLPGWLEQVALLHRSESPGATCVEALRSGQIGRLQSRLNTSRGCGGVVRAAPGGYLVPGMAPGASPAEAYHLGCEISAVTHGHDDAIEPAGALAATVASLLAGEGLVSAVRQAVALCSTNLAGRLARALEVARGGPPTAEVIEVELGSGRSGDEALAIAVACACGAQSFSEALFAAVNHSGSSVATGSICGSLRGASDGIDALPVAWLSALDGRWLVEEVADDCLAWLSWCAEPDGTAELGERWLRRYA